MISRTAPVFAAAAALGLVLALVLLPGGSAPRPAGAALTPDAVLQQACLDDGAVGAGHAGLAADCALLLAAKDPLRGTETLNWSADRAIADWEGITVSGTPPRVTRLWIDRNTSPRQIGRRITLTGTIPAALGGLTALERLTLSRHALTGPIPPELGLLTNLEDLQLYGNALTGPIPPELGQLTNLTRLALQINQLTGPIPVELGNLTNLRTLDLQNNSGLTGAIPASLGDLPNLDLLRLYNNSGLTGCIPPGLDDLSISDLEHLDLEACTITTTYGLTTAAGAGGRISPLPGTYSYLSGDRVTVTATPDPDHRLSAWSGACSSVAATTATCPLTMDAAKSAGVTFVRVYTLTTTVGAHGAIDPAPGRHAYNAGSSVTLTATPDPGYQVAAWEGACSAVVAPATTCALTMDADQTAGVTFVRVYTLTVTVTGDGSVTPSGATTHPDGAVVPLTARWNDATHRFTGWGGACHGTATTCELTIDADKTVTATFAALAASRCATPGAADCLRAVYRGAPGDYAQVSDIPADVLVPRGADGRYTVARDQQITVVTAAPLPTGYTRFYLQWTPLGTPAPTSQVQLIPPVGTTYTFTPTAAAAGPTLITFDLTAARPHPVRPTHKPELGAVIVTTVVQVAAQTLRYPTLDTTGAVTTAGSYAFLEDPDDTGTAVTTYEGLRDGSTTALLVHQADGYGASQAALYDAVAVDDLVEWRQAPDCFVRYQVTAVKPDPTGTVPQKLLGVTWMTYAFTGCTGTIATTTAATLDWSDLPDLGGASLTTPVRHGLWQIVPQGMTSVMEEPVSLPHPPLVEPSYTEDLATARQLPRWRDPALPDGWILLSALAGVDRAVYGYRADFGPDDGLGSGLVIYGKYASYRGGWEWGSWRTTHDKLGVHATRLIAGRPALVRYSPLGPNHNPLGGAVVWIYDAATESEYRVSGKARSLRGPNIEALIAIARSLFEPPNAP